MIRLAMLALCAAASCTAANAGSASYKIVNSIALGAPDRWDYVSFDPASGHVMVAHSDHTDIIDPAAGRIVGKLDGLKGAHGQAASGSVIFADSGETGMVTAFDAASYKPLKTLPAGADADGVAYDPASRVLLVVDGDPATATLIDADTRTPRATVKLGGNPESPVADGMGHFYIDLASTRQVAVLDVKSNIVTARYAIPDCESPHGIAMDPKTARVFVSCKNMKLVVLDAAKGTELQSLPIGRGTDSAAFDPVHDLVFSSNGSGTLSVFHEDDAGTLTKLAEVKTAPGARTMATDPASGRVFLVTGDEDGKPAPGQHARFKPGSVKLLVLQPG